MDWTKRWTILKNQINPAVVAWSLGGRAAASFNTSVDQIPGFATNLVYSNSHTYV